jgi:hypothetical protein
MNIDEGKLEQTVLALLHLTSFKVHHRPRAWKGHDWQVMNVLYEKGYISDPATKAKSVALTEEGAKLSKELFEKLFTKSD